MSEKHPFLEPNWENLLENTLSDSRIKDLFSFIKRERDKGKTIYPEQASIFNALNSTPIDKTRVVILGQDPYHGEGQANGLSFSVERDMKIPPSLRNIYKELEADIGCESPNHGDLTNWASQGVLLLNSVMSVEHGLPASHKNKGWEWFTDQVIEQINEQCNNVVFMLWGAYAQKKGRSIDLDKHLVLLSVHPSPLSAHRGFFGCKHFSKVNAYLKQKGYEEISWQIE